jgi:hypothetical protein
VQVGQGKSNKTTILTSVPQGSVSGPVLFNAVTAELGDIVLLQNTTCIVYADDWTIIKPILTPGCLNDLQPDVGKMFSAIEKTGNIVNKSKTGLLTRPPLLLPASRSTAPSL